MIDLYDIEFSEKMRLEHLFPIALFALQSSASATQARKTCTIKASGTNQTDDAPAIRKAFKECGRHGKVVFEPTTYHVNSVLNITGLEDVDIDVQGQILVRSLHSNKCCMGLTITSGVPIFNTG